MQSIGWSWIIVEFETNIEERIMRTNWIKTSVLAFAFNALFMSHLSPTQAQPGGGESPGINDLFSTNDSPKNNASVDEEALRAQQEFRGRFKGLVHVTHEIRVGNVKAHSQSGLALLIKKSVQDSGGMGYGDTGQIKRVVEYGLLAAKELLRPELPPQIAKLVQTLDATQVSYSYEVRDLVGTSKMAYTNIVYKGREEIVDSNGICLLKMTLNDGPLLVTEVAELDILNPINTAKLEYYDVIGKKLEPTATQEAKIGSVLVSANGGVGIAITRNGKIETLSGRELFNAYVDLLLLKKKQQMPEDPFGSAPGEDPFGDSEPAVAVNDKRNSDPFAADVAKKSPSSSKRNADSDSDIEKRSIDDALVLALTAYKQSKDKASKEAAASQLKQILRDQFDSLRAVRRAEIEDLRTRLDRLESDEKSKTNRRDEVIDQRFQQLIQ
jgi:hypothetical protein